MDAGKLPSAFGDRPHNLIAKKLRAHNFSQNLFAQYNITVALLDFPRFVSDVEFLWSNLSPVFCEINKLDFYAALYELGRPEWGHQLQIAPIAK
jgi:hypothetical protein